MKLEFHSKTNHLSAHGESTDEELKPCPFCGGENILVENTHTPSYRARCDECGAEGPEEAAYCNRPAPTRKIGEDLHRRAFKAAVEAWNFRHYPED